MAGLADLAGILGAVIAFAQIFRLTVRIVVLHAWRPKDKEKTAKKSRWRREEN